MPSDTPTRGYSFTDFSSNQPTQPLPGDRLDTELDRAFNALAEFCDRIDGLFDPDGSLKSQVVGPNTIGPTTLASWVSELTGQLQPLVDSAAGAEQNVQNWLTQVQNLRQLAEDQANIANQASSDAQTNAANVQLLRDQTEAARTQTIQLVASITASQQDVETSATSARIAEDMAYRWAEKLDGPVFVPNGGDAVNDGFYSSKWWALYTASQIEFGSYWYLGVHPTPPTTANDGSPLVPGMWYFDSGDNQTYIWDGTQWDAISGNIGEVISVFGRKGTVQALEADYEAFYLKLSGGDIAGKVRFPTANQTDHGLEFQSETGQGDAAIKTFASGNLVLQRRADGATADTQIELQETDARLSGASLAAAATHPNSILTLSRANALYATPGDLDDYLPLAGGTLSGPLFGTQAQFFGNVLSDQRLVLTTLKGTTADPVLSFGDTQNRVGFHVDGANLTVSDLTDDWAVFEPPTTTEPQSPLALLTRDKGDSRYTRWGNLYSTGASYSKHAMVRQGDWLVIANKDTTEQPVTAALDAVYLGESSTLTSQGTQSEPVWYTGQKYTWQDGGFFEGYRFRVPNDSASFEYALFARATASDGSQVVSQPISWQTFVGAGTDWITVPQPVTVWTPGTTLEVYLGVRSVAQPNTFTANWDVFNSNTTPASGEANFRSSGTEIRVNYFDKLGANQAGNLVAVAPGGTLQFAGEEWTITSVTDSGTYVEYGLAPVQGRPSEAERSLTFSWGDADPLPVDADTTFWSGSTNIRGLQGTDLDGLTETDGQYGVDILLREVVVSDDWDVMAVSGGGGGLSGGGSGGGDFLPLAGGKLTGPLQLDGNLAPLQFLDQGTANQHMQILPPDARGDNTWSLIPTNDAGNAFQFALRYSYPLDYWIIGRNSDRNDPNKRIALHEDLIPLAQETADAEVRLEALIEDRIFDAEDVIEPYHFGNAPPLSLWGNPDPTHDLYPGWHDPALFFQGQFVAVSGDTMSGALDMVDAPIIWKDDADLTAGRIDRAAGKFRLSGANPAGDIQLDKGILWDIATEKWTLGDPQPDNSTDIATKGDIVDVNGFLPLTGGELSGLTTFTSDTYRQHVRIDRFNAPDAVDITQSGTGNLNFVKADGTAIGTLELDPSAAASGDSTLMNRIKSDLRYLQLTGGDLMGPVEMLDSPIIWKNSSGTTSGRIDRGGDEFRLSGADATGNIVFEKGIHWDIPTETWHYGDPDLAQGASELATVGDIVTRGGSFRTRAEAVTAATLAVITWQDGDVISVKDEVYFEYKTGETSVSDMPGWRPRGLQVRPEHFLDNVTPGTTPMTQGWVDAMAFIAANPVTAFYEVTTSQEQYFDQMDTIDWSVFSNQHVWFHDIRGTCPAGDDNTLPGRYLFKWDERVTGTGAMRVWVDRVQVELNNFGGFCHIYGAKSEFVSWRDIACGQHRGPCYTFESASRVNLYNCHSAEVLLVSGQSPVRNDGVGLNLIGAADMFIYNCRFKLTNTCINIENGSSIQFVGCHPWISHFWDPASTEGYAIRAVGVDKLGFHDAQLHGYVYLEDCAGVVFNGNTPNFNQANGEHNYPAFFHLVTTKTDDDGSEYNFTDGYTLSDRTSFFLDVKNGGSWVDNIQKMRWEMNLRRLAGDTRCTYTCADMGVTDGFVPYQTWKDMDLWTSYVRCGFTPTQFNIDGARSIHINADFTGAAGNSDKYGALEVNGTEFLRWGRDDTGATRLRSNQEFAIVSTDYRQHLKISRDTHNVEATPTATGDLNWLYNGNTIGRIKNSHTATPDDQTLLTKAMADALYTPVVTPVADPGDAVIGQDNVDQINAVLQALRNLGAIA